MSCLYSFHLSFERYPVEMEIELINEVKVAIPTTSPFGFTYCVVFLSKVANLLKFFGAHVEMHPCSFVFKCQFRHVPLRVYSPVNDARPENRCVVL